MKSYRVGQYEITPLFDGPLPSSLEKIPDLSHRAEAERLVSAVGPHALILEVYAFLVRGEGQTILIDTGTGNLKGPALGKVSNELQRLGVEPSAVTAILMTHLHGDHYGGLIGEDGPAFINAKLFIHEKEAAFFYDVAEADMPERGRKILAPVRDVLKLYEGKIQIVGTEEVFAGINALPAPGHSYGHTCWHIRSQGQSMLALGDLIHISYIHLKAPYIAMEYDLDPKQALGSRLRILNWVADEDILIAGAHLPSPGVGKIKRDGNCFAFEAQ